MTATVDAVSSVLRLDAASSGTNVQTTFTIAADANYAVLFIDASLQAGNSDSSIAFSVMTIGGQTPTQVPSARVHSGAGTSGFVDMYTLANPPTGSQTVSITMTHSGTPGAVGQLIARCVSYKGAGGGLGTAQTASTTVGTASISVSDGSVGANDLFVGMACNGSSAPTITTGTSDASDTGTTTTGSDNANTAHNAGTSLAFSVNSADNSALTGIKILAGGGAAPGRATRLITFVKEVGTVTNSTAATTSAITVAAGGVPVGHTVFVLSSADNSGSGGAIQATTVSDTRGNFWNMTTHAIADPGAANAGQEGFIAWAFIVVALQASDTITVTWPASTTAKAVRADEFTNVGMLIDQQVQNNQTAQSVSVTATPTGVGQLVIGGVAVEGGTADAFTQDTDTTNGSWVNPGRLGSGTTTAGATLNPIYKIVTAAGAQTYDHATMLGTSRDHCAMLAVFACLPYDARQDAAFGRHHARRMGRRR